MADGPVTTTAGGLGRPASPVMVGRGRELARLLETLAHPPAVVLVEGEAGVGKTRLIEELLARAELGGFQRLVGRCYPLGEPFPLGAPIDALHGARLPRRGFSPVVGALAPLLPELGPRLPQVPEPLGDARAERHRRFRAMRELLSALGFTVLVLEDLHWADQATLELLRFLAVQMPAGLTLVGTYRRQDLPDGSPLLGLAAGVPTGTGVVQVELEPLGRESVRELVATILGIDEVSEEFADHLHDRTGGLPFAVEEVLLLLEQRRDLVHRRDRWLRRDLEELGVPDGLRDSILERLSRLRPASRQVVQAAAVLRASAPESVVAEVAALTDADVHGALAEALSSAMLVEVAEDRFALRHQLASQAIEEGVPSPLRRALHLRAARALEEIDPKPLVRLANHYRTAGHTASWIGYAEAAADRASSLDDDATAYRLLREAVSGGALGLQARTRVATKLAMVAHRCLEHDEAIGILRTLLDDPALSPPRRGELRLWLGRLLNQAGETAAGYEQVELALAELDQRPEVAAFAMVLLGWPDGLQSRVDDHLHWLDRAAEFAARSNDPALRLLVAGDRAAILLLVGDHRGWEALSTIPAPGASAEEVRHAARACLNLSNSLLVLGHCKPAQERIREGLQLAAQVDFAQVSTLLKATQLQLDWAMGMWDGLEKRARYYLEAGSHWPQVQAVAETVLALLLLARGKPREARRLLERLVADLPSQVEWVPSVAGALARLRLAADDGEAAWTEASRGLETVRRTGVWAWATDVVPVAIEALLATGRRDDAAELAEQFGEGLRGRDAPAAEVSLVVCRALLDEADGKLDLAAAGYQAAAAAWRDLARPYEVARARERIGGCLVAAGDEHGRSHLTEALDGFRNLGAEWDAARVLRTLRGYGLTPPHRRGRKGYGTALSPRELQVVSSARAGLTNREIALELYLSPRTVEHHLSAALRKLGVGSRAELAAQIQPD